MKNGEEKPPRIEDLSVAPQGQGFREGDMSQRTESITQSLPGGQKVEYSATIGGSKPLREMPLWASGLRTLQWRGLDPNGDALRYQVFVRREPEGAWIEIGKDLEVSVLTWNTHTLGGGVSGVDFNRAGVPLLEIVTELQSKQLITRTSA